VSGSDWLLLLAAFMLGGAIQSFWLSTVFTSLSPGQVAFAGLVMAFSALVIVLVAVSRHPRP
jgi:hypothetical protein